MISRDRVLAAIDHEIPDRVPVHVMGFGAIEALERYVEYFRVEADPMALRHALGLDTFCIQPPVYADPEMPEGMTIWGTLPHQGNTGYSQSRGGHPLQDAETVADVEKHSWPSVKNLDWSPLQLGLHYSVDKARILGYSWQPTFCRLMDLFGMEEALVKIQTHPEVIEAAISHISDYLLELTERAMTVAAKDAEIFFYGDDFATQRGMMISPESWRRFIKPVYARLFEVAKLHGLKVWFHCCGTFVDVLPDLIDIGMDVWETCQVHLAGNDPRFLKREFGTYIAFFGAINTQRTLPFGTPEEIRKEVRERIDVLGKGGGYICGPDHTVEQDVSIENLLALLDEAKRYRNPECVSGPNNEEIRGVVK